jgi:hypothetical protein
MRNRRTQVTIVLILGLHCTAIAAPVQADKIVILKSAHSMSLLSGSKVLKTYKVALGSVPVGPKRVEGDHKTPEGDYLIDSRTRIASSTCHYTSLIPARQISRERVASVLDRVEQS